MSKTKTIIEYRSYELPPEFPVLMLTGEDWHISDIPSGKLHFHNCLELGICHTQSGWMEFDGQRVDFHEGDVTVISRNIPHTTCSAPGCASLWSYLYLAPEDFLRGFFSDAAPEVRTYREMLENSRFILHGSEYPAIREVMLQILGEMKAKATNYQFSVAGLTLSLMMQLMRVYQNSKHASASSSGAKADMAQNALVIAPALDYIRDNYMQNFPVDLLADLCHLSPTHFRRVFHEIMEMSPLDYLNRTRILQSCSMLRMTEDSILSVSERVGFRSISSYNRHFLTFIGLTPTEWRKKVAPAQKASILRYNGWMKAETPGS